MRDPIATWRTITMGTAAVLDAARRWRARVLLASTSEIYGEPEIHPQHERYFGNVDATSPRSCYAEGKRAAETLASAHAHQGLDVRITRLFNVYGPGMRHDDGRVVASFIQAALLGEDLVIQGDGRQTRSFCYVDDLVDGLVRLMEQAAPATGPVNLGNPQEVTIEELALLIRDLTGSPSSLRFEEARESDPSRRRPDIAKASALLGWTPVVPLRKGLANTVAFFEAELRRLQHHGFHAPVSALPQSFS
ncbi:NAD-dependent epimerase/dehydratase family protein [Bosea sp. TND4EK4]|uniref:NAD-dependent epimerase/dehydratase family protein n=1 Tax=Bosea sp. TND4EK4 TaxID=1907408 RepID=UPI0032B000CC